MKRKLGELLIESGAVTSSDVERVLADQSAGEPSRVGDLLLSTGRCTPRQLAEALAVQHQIGFSDLSYVAPEASSLIPLEFQRAHKLVAFRLDEEQGIARVHVALADPTVGDLVDELRSHLNREIVVHVAAIDDIENVHLALSGEPAEGGVLVGTVVEETALIEATADETSLELPPEITAGLSPAAVTAEDLFGSMDLEAPSTPVPLSTDLADQIGRADETSAHFSEIPSNDLDRGLNAAPTAPAPIETIAIPPEEPVEPLAVVAAAAAPRGPATLGRIALKRVAVPRESVKPVSAAVAVESVPDSSPAPQPLADLALPDWMRQPPEGVGAAVLSAKLEAVLAQVEGGDLKSGVVLAALIRLLIERGVVDQGALGVALEKIQPL